MRKKMGRFFFFFLAVLCNTLIQFLIGLHAYDLTSQSEILWPFSYQKWLCRNSYLPVLKKNKTYQKMAILNMPAFIQWPTCLPCRNCKSKLITFLVFFLLFFRHLPLFQFIVIRQWRGKLKSGKFTPFTSCFTLSHLRQLGSHRPNQGDHASLCSNQFYLAEHFLHLC